MEEEIKLLFKIWIERYEKVNTMNVGITARGQNVIYKKIKMSEDEIDFMKKYLEEHK